MRKRTPEETQARKAEKQSEGAKAMQEYTARAEATRARTAKLRALRLAKAAQDAEGKKP
jgi:hypothetical protein